MMTGCASCHTHWRCVWGHTHIGATQVIKIGTSSLTNEKYGTLNLSSLSRVCEVVRELHAQGERLCLLCLQQLRACICLPCAALAAL